MIPFMGSSSMADTGWRCFVARRHPQNPARAGKVPCEPTKWYERALSNAPLYSWVMKSNCVENDPGSVFSCYNPKSRERIPIGTISCGPPVPDLICPPLFGRTFWIPSKRVLKAHASTKQAHANTEQCLQ